MTLALIAAVASNGVIGKGGGLPWRLPADLARFKALTMGHHVIMGRKTYESIGRPLPGRKMIVITRNPDLQAEGCQIAHSLEEALGISEKAGENEAFVIGGGEIFALALPLADRIYLTRVHTITQADTFFPEFKEVDWSISGLDIHPADEKNQFPSSFKILSKGTGSSAEKMHPDSI